MEHKWKRGTRVRYTAPHCASLTGKTGTVTGRDDRGWLRVRFDHQQSFEKGIRIDESSLEPEEGARLDYVAHAEAMRTALADVAHHAVMTINALAEPSLIKGNGDDAAAARRALDNARALRSFSNNFDWGA